MQSIKATQKVLDEMPNSYNLLHLRLKMCAVAYKLAVGKYVDMQIMLCHMFRRVQSLYDSHHEIVISLMSEIGVCLNMQVRCPLPHMRTLQLPQGRQRAGVLRRCDVQCTAVQYPSLDWCRHSVWLLRY